MNFYFNPTTKCSCFFIFKLICNTLINPHAKIWLIQIAMVFKAWVLPLFSNIYKEHWHVKHILYYSLCLQKRNCWLLTFLTCHQILEFSGLKWICSFSLLTNVSAFWQQFHIKFFRNLIKKNFHRFAEKLTLLFFTINCIVVLLIFRNWIMRSFFNTYLVGIWHCNELK